MKLLLILLLVLGVVSVLTAKTRKTQPPGMARRMPGRALRASLAIRLLRALRAGVLTTAVVTVVMIGKFVLLFPATYAAEDGPLQLLKLSVLILLMVALLRFLWMLFFKLRTKVNRLHSERSQTAELLLRDNWSL
ncbi:MAG: hypothetical protein JWP47_723 [Polaromonas sp.]|jgi:Mg2+/Co2+ transporter CorB|nr:hypothetical protein [Polaromonas sp.]